jgi:hypothetical protein
MPHDAIVVAASVGTLLQLYADMGIESQTNITFHSICSVTPSYADFTSGVLLLRYFAEAALKIFLKMSSGLMASHERLL